MKHMGAAAGVIAVLALAGCSSSHEDTHKTPSKADNQVAYIATVRSHLGLDEYDDAKLRTIAKQQCAMLDTGSTDADVVDVMADHTNGRYTRAQLAYWVGAATSAYCPTE